MEPKTWKKKEKHEHLTHVNMVGLFPIGADPLGSYSGHPEDPHEIPVQDADDL